MIYLEPMAGGEIGLIHYMPFDPIYGLGKTAAQLLQTGILVDSLPTPDPSQGIATLKYNKSSNLLFYEYVDAPKSSMDVLTERVDDLTVLFADMIGGAL